MVSYVYLLHCNILKARGFGFNEVQTSVSMDSVRSGPNLSANITDVKTGCVCFFQLSNINTMSYAFPNSFEFMEDFSTSPLSPIHQNYIADTSKIKLGL